MPSYISELDVSLDAADEQMLRNLKFKTVRGNLDAGICGSKIRLWYKESEKKSDAITRIQVSFTQKMADALADTSYSKISKNVNAGGGGDAIYLWYLRGSGENHSGIIDISVTTDTSNEAEKFANGYERVACDLNRGSGGAWIHIWLKREEQTYISDIKATDSHGSDANNFEEGYIRVDEDINRGAGASSPVFIWYLPTLNSKSVVTDLKVSINETQEGELQQNYQQVSVNLNEGTNGNRAYLWYKKGDKYPVKVISLLQNLDLVDEYKKRGARVIERNLNEGNCGRKMFLCYTIEIP